MVIPSALLCMPLYFQVNCDRLLDRQKSQALLLLGGFLVLFEAIWWAGCMDPQQSPLPMQLHGNSFAMSSGQVPNLRAGYNGGGGQVAELNQQNMTSSAHVPSRLNPNEQFQCPVDPLVQHHDKGKLDIKSRSCSLFTICHAGLIFPWMNPRTPDSNQSGNSIFPLLSAKNVFFFLTEAKTLEYAKY